MREIIALAFLLMLHSSTCSQVIQDWVKIFGGKGYERCYSISQTNDNNYIIVGRIYSEVSRHVNYMIVKLNSDGEEIWRKSSDCKSSDCNCDDETRDFILNSKGELIIAGNRGDYPLILKTNAFGDTIWTKHMNDNLSIVGQIRTMGQISDTDFVVAGVNGDMFHPGENKFWAIRIDDEGKIKWSNIYTNGFANSLTITNRNDIVLIGGNKLLKLNINGSLLWECTITGNYSYGFYSVKETKDKGLILVGYSEGCCYKDLCLIKTDSIGNKLWEKIYGGGWEEVGLKVMLTNDDGYIVLGRSPETNSGGAYKLWLMRTDANGDSLWTKKFTLSNDIFSYAYPESFIMTKDAKIIAIGNSTTNSSGDVWFVAKYSLLSSSINQYPDELTKDLVLFQNYPNPFNPTTKIKFNIPYGTDVKLSIYDITGKLIAKLIDQYLPHGLYEIEYDGCLLSSGIYFYQLQTGNNILNRKMLLIK